MRRGIVTGGRGGYVGVRGGGAREREGVSAAGLEGGESTD